MAKIVTEGKHVYWVDGEGLKVPAKLVKEEDKRRDLAVRRLVSKAKALQATITSTKKGMEAAIQEYLGEAANREGEEWVGGTTISDFSQRQSVTVKVAKRWTFDERLQIAKTKIDKVIETRSKGSDDLIVALVNRAFRVDQKGNVDAKELIGLRTMKVNDVLWNEAMDLIADSMKVQGTKVYFYFQEADEDGKMQTITLDFSAL